MKTKLEGLISFAEFLNPYHRTIRFVLTDFQPNANKEMIPREEAENVIRTAKFSPVKIHFTGKQPAGHAFAEPIGTITDAYLDEDKIVAEARIWESEDEHVVRWMEESVKEQKPITFSWELIYDNDSSPIVNGVKLLKNVVMVGVSIVRDAAYGMRTRLLSFAQGEPMEEKLISELEELRKFRETVMSRLESAKVFAERQQRLGFDLTPYFNLITGLSSEQFEELVSLIESLKPKLETAPALAVSESLPRIDVPNIQIDEISPLDLAKYLRGIKV